jgi:lysophospholipase L1-like esterase
MRLNFSNVDYGSTLPTGQCWSISQKLTNIYERLLDQRGFAGNFDMTLSNTRSVWILLLVLALNSGLLVAGDPTVFRPEIRAFEVSDWRNPPPQNPVVFAGSSSFRLWRTLETDFRQFPVINRGFGGSQMSDLLYYLDPLVIQYSPRAILVYEGDNDLASGKSPAQVLADFQQFYARTRRALPIVPIVFLAVKPSPVRRNLMDAQRELNGGLAKFAATHLNCGFIDTFTPLLNSAGQPRPELYAPDQLHLNSAGYAIWRQTIAPFLPRLLH